jgi:branched-chain amino acid aminotransferase
MHSAPLWVNGTFSDRIDPLDRGFLLGDGVFDTLVALRRIPFAGEEHLQRLGSHAAAIGLTLDAGAVRDGWTSVLSRADDEHLVLRTTVTRGMTERGLWPRSQGRPTIVVSASPWHPRLLRRDIALIVSSIPRNAGSPSSRLKTLGYLDNVLAAREAAESGADDALFLTHAGHVACTTIANIFAVEGSNLLTAPPADGILSGIVRGLVLRAAIGVGLHPIERSFRLEELHKAKAVFVTNSVRFISRVRSIGRRALNADGDAVCTALQSAISGQLLQECGLKVQLPE